MPTKSDRKICIQDLECTLEDIHSMRYFLSLFEGEDGLNIDNILFEEAVREELDDVKSNRYFERSRSGEGERSRSGEGGYRDGKAYKFFQEDLETEWLSNSDFKRKYCMSRESFWKLHNLIKDHNIFKTPHAGCRQQLPSQYQLMVLLAFLRTEGDGMSNQKARNVFRIGNGTVQKYRERVVTAIIDNLLQQTVFWPDETERDEISKRFQAKYNLPNLVGVADGTLLPLAFRPSREDASDYHGRKFLYSLTVLVVNDDQKRVRYFHIGWPGCTHDDRVMENSRLKRLAHALLSKLQYIIGDSAYSARWWLVPCYKKSAGCSLPRENELFNNTLSKPRVTSEHTIGMLKGRFPFLRSIRLRLNETKESMTTIVRHVTVCIILHNLLIGYGDEAEVDQDDLSDIDADNELNRPVPDVAATGTRREQLKNYIVENYF